MNQMMKTCFAPYPILQFSLARTHSTNSCTVVNYSDFCVNRQPRAAYRCNMDSKVKNYIFIKLLVYPRH